MKKLHSQFIGTKVMSERERATISIITGAHIDPETGKLIALVCGFRHVILPREIIDWNTKGVVVADSDSLIHPKDLVRLSQRSKLETEVLLKPVFTEQGEQIGSVKNYTIDTEAMILVSIDVKRTFLFFVLFETIIQHKDIVEILPDKVIVKDLMKAEKVTGALAEPA